MSEQSIGGTPRAFLVIGIVALLWNLLGVFFYLMEVTRSPEALAKMPEAQQALIGSMPSWLTGAYATAVFVGLLACVGLLLKKAWALPLFIVSLVAIVLQMGYWLFMTNSLEVYGPGGLVMPVIVTSIGCFLVWYSRDAKAKGWLS